jgi:ribosomal protein S18 acetylase RimI-like enzyme
VASSATDVIIRPAATGDVERIAEIMHGEPGPELVGIVGDSERARRFGRGLVLLERIPNVARPMVVAESGGAVVGVLQYTLGTPTTGANVERVRLALRVAGPVRLARALPRLRARQRVDLMPPPDAFYIAELHVDPARRSEGIGARLLAWADDEAARLGRARLALNTYSTNRARHLYDRAGYTVTGERTDPRYEQYTGIPGRVLMEKQLGITHPS